MDTPYIQIHNVHKEFDSQPVLDDVSIDVQKGESIVIIGQSGCGKSVLLKHILRLIEPDRGAISVDGQNLAELNDGELTNLRRRMGMLFQSAALFDSMTVEENVGLGLREARKYTEDQVLDIVNEKLEMVGLSDAAHKRPAELSGGMRKRVGMARAIAGSPELLLYDEPTTGLDPMTSLTVDAEIIKLRDLERVTSVLVTHQLRDAFYVATHSATPNGNAQPKMTPATAAKIEEADFVMIRDGAVAFEGSADELRRSEDPYLKTFLS